MSNIWQFSVRYQGPKFFNSLEDEIVNSISFQSFTVKLKMFTINVFNSSFIFNVTVAILHNYIICNYFLGGNS